MARKPRRSREAAEPAAGLLASALGPHLDDLGAAAAERAERRAAERAAARASIRRLDEAELMTLIFAHLDPDNPRVCEGIEFERLVILSAPAPEPEPESAPEPRASCDPGPTEPSVCDPSSSASDPVTAELAPPLDPAVWVGRTWIDDIRPIAAAVLDRPELDADQRALLVRASRRELASLNLRHLGRAEALAHFELFVRACRNRRLRHCRVIPGKGVGSRVEPVLKRAVLEACREPASGVLGWAPELDRHGEWGAVILELRAPGR